MATRSLPTSYTNLPFAQIKLSHHPVTSPTPTPVILITLNRPTKNNAFTSAMENDLVRAFNLLDLDDRVKVIVVTGAGRMFCAGADLEVGFNRKEGIDGRDNRDGGGRVALAVHRCRKPTIAAINGAAVGVGITMTLPMSIRIVSSTSKVAFPFNRRGLIMEACSSFFLPRLIGHSRALYLTTTGSVFPASSPHFGDLFNEIVGTSEEVLPRALELAGEIAGKTSGVSNYLMPELMWRGPLTAEETHLLDSRIMWALYAGADVKEGVGAFLEKRDPAFKADIETGVPDCVPWWNQVDIEPRRNLDGKSKL